MPRPADRRELLRIVASVAATAALAAWVAVRVDLRAVGVELASARKGWLLGAALLGPVQAALAAERWRIASGRLARPIPRPRAIREVALSMLLNQLLPGGIAGDAIRAWRASHGGLLGAVRAVMVDRYVGLAVHLAVVVGALAIWPRVEAVGAPPGAGWITAGLVAALALLTVAPAALPAMGSLGADLRACLGHPPTAAAMIALSAVLTATFLLGFAACGEALGQPLGWGTVTAVPLVLLAMAVPLGFGGFGLREATAALLLPLLGIPAESAVAISAAYGLSALIGSMPGALVPLWER